MHETALARQILSAVLERAEGRRVRAIHGIVAEDEVLNAEALELHFRAHARGTSATSARLDLQLRHVSARCSACGSVYLPDHHVRLCPECGCTEAELEGETGVRITSIEVDEP